MNNRPFARLFGLRLRLFKCGFPLLAFGILAGVGIHENGADHFEFAMLWAIEPVSIANLIERGSFGFSDRANGHKRHSQWFSAVQISP